MPIASQNNTKEVHGGGYSKFSSSEIIFWGGEFVLNPNSATKYQKSLEFLRCQEVFLFLILSSLEALS